MEALRQLGRMLEAADKNKGAAGGDRKSEPRGSYVEPRDKTPTLAELGMTQHPF